jgi:DNA-binding response OmpR family regulator
MNAWLNRSMTVQADNLDPLRVGTIILIPTENVVSLDNGSVIHLTNTETRLLYVLMSRAGRTFPTRELIQRIWKEKEEAGLDILKNSIYRLRQKLEAQPANLHCILTVPGVGYKFDLHAEQGTAQERDQDNPQ